MEPLYFNPLDSSGNYIGTDPLKPTGVPIQTTVVTISGNLSCYDPSLYQSYTFFDSPFYPYSYVGPTTFFQSSLIGSNVVVNSDVLGDGQNTGISLYGGYGTEFYSTQIFYSTQFSTFYSTYAASYQIDQVTFSIRFGTEFQTLYGSTSMATNVVATYENIYTEQIFWYCYTVNPTNNPRIAYQTCSSLLASGLYSSFVIQTTQYPQRDGLTVLGSSTFVNMLGSNVYSALLDTTNSVIIYQNEQISSYYSQSLSYQVNIANLTAALNNTAINYTSDTGYVGGGGDSAIITVTTFSWYWYTTAQGWTGSQVIDFPDYTTQETVDDYLYSNYGGSIITGDSDIAITQIQSLLSIQNNNLANAQTFLNNAVTTLQSQVSLAGQIITALASGMETLINDI